MLSHPQKCPYHLHYLLTIHPSLSSSTDSKWGTSEQPAFRVLWRAQWYEEACPTKPRAWPKLQFTLHLRVTLQNTQNNTAQMFHLNSVKWLRWGHATSHLSGRLICFFSNGNWMEETTHLKQLHLCRDHCLFKCAGQPGKTLKHASSMAKDGQFVVMYKKVQHHPLMKEEIIKDSNTGILSK